MLKYFCPLLLLICSTVIYGQSKDSLARIYNDTIVYKTGYGKPVKIDSFAYNVVYYHYFNKTLYEEKKSEISINHLKRFVIYDEEGVLIYDSKMDYALSKPDKKVDSLKVFEHDLSVNPFTIPLLSPSVRYTWKFGNYMQWGITTRFTYLSPVVIQAFDSSLGVLMFGVGPRFMPYYSRKLCFGIDLTPMFMFGQGEFVTLVPLGLAIDFGAGYAFGSGYSQFAGRGHLGFLIRLGKKYNVPNASNSIK